MIETDRDEAEEAAGFFRVGRIGRDGARYGFVAPDGRGFPASGINHAKWTTAEYNPDRWADTVSQRNGFCREHAAIVRNVHEKTGLPVLLADSSYSVVAGEMPRRCGPRLASQEDPADAFGRYFGHAIADPLVVGRFRCGHIDGYRSVEPSRRHAGIRDPWGIAHQPLYGRIARIYPTVHDAEGLS